MPDYMAKPPQDCPDENKSDADTWDQEPLSILKQTQVPWFIIATMAKEGWTTLRHLAARFNDNTDIDDKAPVELGYKSGTNGYTAAQQRRVTFSLQEAVGDAKSIQRQRTESRHRSDEDPTLIMVPGQRESMQAAMKRLYGLTKNPPLDEQGADHFMGSMFKDISRGQLGTYTNKEITAKIPDPHTFLYDVVKKRKMVDGTVQELDHKERRPPMSWEQWKKQMKVWTTTLLMAVAANPHQTHLQVAKDTIDDFYEWMYGTDLMTRHNPPTLEVMMYAERLAWRRIALDIHGGITLTQSITNIRNNTLFWNTEVCERCTRRPQGWGDHDQGHNDRPWQLSTPPRRARGGSGKRRHEDWTSPMKTYPHPGAQGLPSRPSDTGKGKSKGKGKTKGGGQGKGKDGGKGKGKSKGGSPTLVSQNDKGAYYCWPWNKGSCTKQGCTNVHKCAKMRQDGRGCNDSTHGAHQCTKH